MFASIINNDGKPIMWTDDMEDELTAIPLYLILPPPTLNFNQSVKDLRNSYEKQQTLSQECTLSQVCSQTTLHFIPFFT